MPQQKFISQGDTIYTLPVETENVKEFTTSELLKSGQLEELFNRFLTGSIDFIGKLLIALLIFYVGRWIIRQFAKPTKRILERKIEDSALSSFLLNLYNILLFTVLVVIIINVMGTKYVSIAALIGSVGLALGLAVKTTWPTLRG